MNAKNGVGLLWMSATAHYTTMEAIFQGWASFVPHRTPPCIIGNLSLPINIVSGFSHTLDRRHRGYPGYGS